MQSFKMLSSVFCMYCPKSKVKSRSLGCWRGLKKCERYLTVEICIITNRWQDCVGAPKKAQQMSRENVCVCKERPGHRVTFSSPEQCDQQPAVWVTLHSPVLLILLPNCTYTVVLEKSLKAKHRPDVYLLLQTQCSHALLEEL